MKVTAQISKSDHDDGFNETRAILALTSCLKSLGFEVTLHRYVAFDTEDEVYTFRLRRYQQDAEISQGRSAQA